MKDDVIYIVLLLSCIFFGHFYRKICDAYQKKWVGTAFGLLIVVSVSGFHIFHHLVSFVVASSIIVYADRKKCHLYSFVFMFTYLFFFRSTNYFGIELPPGHTNLVQMIMTLKLVGLAGEVNNADSKLKLTESSSITVLQEIDKELLKISHKDIFHYVFNYIGILTGPYYSYKTHRDFFALPFSNYVDCNKETIQKFKWVPFYCGLFLAVSWIYPLSYATSDEFYERRSFFYRLNYIWPTFFIFRMRIYTGIILSECVCTMSGMGAYPKDCDNKSGGGPSKDYTGLVESAEKLEYDFNTIRNIDVMNTEKCITFREAMKYWNMCVQYWMAMNVYKRFPSKRFRTMATLATSAIWHGVYAGYYFCIFAAPFYLPIEDLYRKLFFTESLEGKKRKIYNVICWISKFFALSYMGIAFLLMTIDKIWYYYGSVYHFGYILWIVMFCVGCYIDKNRKVVTKEA